jgi:hypothetical protein
LTALDGPSNGQDHFLNDSLFLKDDLQPDNLIYGKIHQNPLTKKSSNLNITDGDIVTAEDYNVIKLDTNLNNLYRDLENANEEI